SQNNTFPYTLWQEICWSREMKLYHSGKDSRNNCCFGYFFFDEIAQAGVPSIQARPVDAARPHRDHQIAHPGPERFVASAQGHLPVFTGKISAHFGVGMDDCVQAP